MDLKSKTYTIDVKHVTRVEGHGRIIVSTNRGVVKVSEACHYGSNAFFENFRQGHAAGGSPWIVSRICGYLLRGATS